MLILMMCGAFPLSAQTRNIYVSPDGDDAYPGTRLKPKLTITAALAIVNPSAVPPDAVNLAAGIYAEAFSITKPVSIIGAGDVSVIAPPAGSGQGISIRAGNVEVSSLAVKHAWQNGIYIYSVSNVGLTNVLCEADSLDGVLMSNVSNIRLTNVRARLNGRHGVNIGDGSRDIRFIGGAFTSNGSGGFLSQTGAGVNIYSETKITSLISFQGAVDLSKNGTTGLWLSSTSLSGSVDTLNFTGSDTAIFEDNTESAVVMYGRTNHVTLRGKFLKKTTTSVGVVLAGYNGLSECGPQNTLITNSVFSGYDTVDHPAITLSTGWIGRYSPNDALSTNCLFMDATKTADIPYFVYDKRRETRLGRVTLSGSQALPVELSVFNAVAREEYVDLAWETVSEVDNAGFDIERSAAYQQEWGRIAFLPGQGTSQVRTRYAYVDHPPPRGEYLYRLKQIDLGGAFKYSAIVSVRMEPKKPGMTLLENYPNPFNPETTLRFTLAESGNMTAIMYSVLGAKIETIFSGPMEAGIHEIRWRPEASLSGGTYFCVLQTGTVSITRRVVLLR